ncbi:MAG: hypothetical protein ACK55I_16260, partial [bacterium]
MLFNRIVAGFFLYTGILNSLVGFIYIFSDKGSPLPFLFLLGWTSFGIWLTWRNQKQSNLQKERQLRATFIHLLKAKNGRLTVLEFSADTNLSGAEAKKYLDEQ